jgi:hypothetical protein
VLDLAMFVLGMGTFFEMIFLTGLSRVSRTCKRHRYLQLDKHALLGAIVGSTRAKLHLDYRLSLFGMMPRAIVKNSIAATILLNVARDYERNLIPNRRFIYPRFYAFVYYCGICGSRGSDVGHRRRVWGEIASILCEMLEIGEDIGTIPWNQEYFIKRRNNARHYMRK